VIRRCGSGMDGSLIMEDQCFSVSVRVHERHSAFRERFESFAGTVVLLPSERFSSGGFEQVFRLVCWPEGHPRWRGCSPIRQIFKEADSPLDAWCDLLGNIFPVTLGKALYGRERLRLCRFPPFEG
jgi:hypothetical protein